MSRHSDVSIPKATSDNFWEPGNYKRTTKRLEEGNRLCSDLISLIQERASVEKAYAKNLTNWSRKWNGLIEKGPEYGTIEAAWKGVLVEADRISDLHMKVKEDLCSVIIQNVKTWQKDTYHKSIMQVKERKEVEDDFKKAQKPWGKLLLKVNKAKLDYHAACKTEKSVSNQARNASGDSSLSAEKVKKMQDRVAKLKYDVQKSKEKYELSLRELKSYNQKYMDDMTVVFERCQTLEAQRLQFFKDTLFSLHKYLKTYQDPQLPQIYEDFSNQIKCADHEKELNWWSNNHGVNMAMNCPEFEEYAEEFRDIAKIKPKKASSITLINQRPIGEDLPVYPSIRKKIIRVNSSYSDCKSSQNLHQASGDNPFDEDEWDDDISEALIDKAGPGVPVKALYDYVGVEADELSFKQGEIFDKLEESDEQGWCKGKKDGKIGIYPANYVELLAKCI